MLRFLQRRRLLRQASEIPSDVLEHLPDAERALYERMKERLEQKRREGSDWIATEPTITLILTKTKDIHDNMIVDKPISDTGYLFMVESTITEALTLDDTTAMTGEGENTSASASIQAGISLDYSYSTCSQSCCFEKYQKHHSQHDHRYCLQLNGRNSCDGGCCGCGCLSASSSFKQEESEIVFDPECYRHLRYNNHPNTQLFATPFLCDQHLTVLRVSTENLYDHAACSVQSRDSSKSDKTTHNDNNTHGDNSDDCSYSAFFREEIDVDTKMSSSRRLYRHCQAAPTTTHSMVRRPTQIANIRPAVLGDTSTEQSSVALDKNDCCDYFSDDDAFYTARTPQEPVAKTRSISKCDKIMDKSRAQNEEERKAADFSYSGLFLEEAPVVKRKTGYVKKKRAVRGNTPRKAPTLNKQKPKVIGHVLTSGDAPPSSPTPKQNGNLRKRSIKFKPTCEKKISAPICNDVEVERVSTSHVEGHYKSLIAAKASPFRPTNAAPADSSFDSSRFDDSICYVGEVDETLLPENETGIHAYSESSISVKVANVNTSDGETIDSKFVSDDPICSNDKMDEKFLLENDTCTAAYSDLSASPIEQDILNIADSKIEEAKSLNDAVSADSSNDSTKGEWPVIHTADRSIEIERLDFNDKRGVGSTLALFDSLYSSWFAERASDREIDEAEDVSNRQGTPTMMSATSSMLHSSRKAESLYEVVATSESIDSQETNERVFCKNGTDKDDTSTVETDKAICFIGDVAEQLADDDSEETANAKIEFGVNGIEELEFKFRTKVSESAPETVTTRFRITIETTSKHSNAGTRTTPTSSTPRVTNCK